MTRSVDNQELGRLAPDTRIALVVSQYHAQLTEAMLASGLETLRVAGLAEQRCHVVRVPGTFELPLVARRLARRDEIDAVLCYGLVLKGETEHDRYIARAVSDGLMRSSLECDKPILFGVLTCASLGQAQRRARRREEDGLDKGHEVALATIRVLAALQETEQTLS